MSKGIIVNHAIGRATLLDLGQKATVVIFPAFSAREIPLAFDASTAAAAAATRENSSFRRGSVRQYLHKNEIVIRRHRGGI
jgi:hypothetical protein